MYLKTKVGERCSLVAGYDVDQIHTTGRRQRIPIQLQTQRTTCGIVKAVRGILMRECANLYKSMKIGTLVIFDMLCPNLPGAKDNSQWCRHIRQFKMAAA